MKSCGRAVLVLLFLGLTACPHKVPLQENRGQFDVSTSHWFANEKTQYVFFRISALRPAQAKLTWPFALEIATPGATLPAGLKAGADGFAPLDLSVAVHRHHLVECGSGQLCGSFSFHAEQPVQNLVLRYRYNVSSPLTETSSPTVATHPDSSYADSQSALLYGVFNADNSRMQLRVHDNFGDPNSDDIAKFGMERTFEITDSRLTDLSENDELQNLGNVRSPFLFPALACAPSLKNAGSASHTWRFSTTSAWDSATYDPNDTKSAACMNVRALDKKGAPLMTAPAMARRNPELTAQGLKIQPPLRKSHNLSLTIAYCPGHPESDAMMAPDFLQYQRFILGLSKGGIDVCFAAGEEERFARDLERVLDQKLAVARAGNQDGADYFFTVILHHNLPKEIKEFHLIIANKLSNIIAREVRMISPRLVGAFVYDSQSADLRPIPQDSNIVWCPRKEADGAPESDANCTARSAGDITLGPLNFLIPLGPFPTEVAYLDYLQKYHHRGEANNPSLGIQSVQTNANSVTGENKMLFTFFDGERLTTGPGEGLRFCRDRDDLGFLNYLALRYRDEKGQDQVTTVEHAQSVFNRATESGGTSMGVGLWWDSAFYGSMSWDMPLTGKVFGMIPLSKTFRSQQNMGDFRWQIPVWNLSPYLQKCLRYCHHPYFDEAGIYQIASSWKQAPVCPAPKAAQP